MLLVYTLEGQSLLNISVDQQDFVYDATWTPRGKILYSTDNCEIRYIRKRCKQNYVVLMSEAGEIIKRSQRVRPQRFSVSIDNVIYLADYETGVHQSTDDGMNWIFLFKSPDGLPFGQAVKVITENTDFFWTLENDKYNYIRVYNMSLGRFVGDQSWKSNIISITQTKSVILQLSSFLEDGKMNIFLSDYYNAVIHVFTAEGKYKKMILSTFDLEMKVPSSLAINTQSEQLYVGHSRGIIKVFRLVHED